jgi:outer membrane autotransporter protein
MSGRILTERLLATSSLAALLLATAGSHDAKATIGCTAAVPAGSAYTNSVSIPCIAVTASAISVTNTASGVIGPPTTGRTAVIVTNGGTLSGGIVNSGHIVGLSSGSTTGIGVFGLVHGGIGNGGSIAINTSNAGSVEAYGINVDSGGSTFAGGLSNGGTISVAMNGSSVDGDGVFIYAQTFFGNVTNAAGANISVNATASTGSVFIAGLDISASLASGNVVNSGTISAQASSAGSYASAAGVTVYASTFLGGITNSGTITASASATHNCACATGVSLGATMMTGNFSNAGTIAATATGSGTTAFATGVSIGVENLIGGVFNSGTITATATGDSANATALAQYNCNSAHGTNIVSTIVTGGFGNTGILSANATATSGTASAMGAQLGVYSFSGSANFDDGFNNAGLISAAAVGTGNAYAHATAASIYAYGGTGAAFSGGLTNSGTIIATATATGTGEATATGLIVNVSSSGFGPSGNALFSGNIVNSGLISATATSAQSYACATAVRLDTDTLNGNFSNGGTITATASGSSAEATALDFEISTFNGGFSNSGTISATATASGASSGATADGVSGGATVMTGNVVNSGTIIASATQNNVAGGGRAEAAALDVYVTTMFGNFANSGTIAANAIASGTATSALARATGVVLNFSTMFGNITNSGIISATALQKSGDTCANALAMSVDVETMLGNLSNSGVISASGTALAGYATVTGLSVSVSTMLGAIVNSGTISAVATANGAACATGLSVEAAQLGGITNSGTIVATASGSFGCARGVNLQATVVTGNFSNSGTIAASFTATGGGSGTAAAIRFGATSFSGTLTNSGTITATRTGNGTAVGIDVPSLQSGAPTIANSGTISATDIAINLSNSGVAFEIDQTAGHILGNTAIAFSTNGDTLNASGGKIEGALVGPTSGTLPTINVAAGSGTFTYAGTTTNIGTINVNSGTLLVATQANGAYSAVSAANFTQAAGGTLGVAVSPTTNMGAILTATNMTLAGPLAVYENAAAWQPGTTYTYTDALTAGTLTGAFTSVGSNSPLFTASVTQSANSDTITLGLLPLGSVPGLSGNDRSVLGALETLLANPNTSSSVVNTLGQIYTLNSTSQLGSLATSLSGQQNTQTFQYSQSAWSQFTGMLIDRLFGGGGEGTTGVASFSKGQGIQFAQADIPQVAQASDAARPGVAPSRQPSKWGVWARGYGSWASAPSTASSASYDESGAGVIIGGDAQITSKLVGGFAFNIGTNNVDSADGARNDINTYQGALYGKYAVDPHIYVAGLAGFGWQDYDARRFIVAPISASATSNYSGQGYRLYGESGYAFHLAGPLPDTTVTPYVGLGYLHTHVDSFTEAGGGGAALSVDAVDANSFTTSLGARATTSLRIGNTLLKPEVRVAWQHEWLDDSTNVQSAFASAPGSVFTVTGAGFGRDSFIGGAGISTTLAGFGVTDPRFAPTQLFVDYDVKTTGGYLANVVSGGFRAKF